MKRRKIKTEISRGLSISSIKNILRIFKYDYSKIITSWVTVVILVGLTVLPAAYAWLNIYASWDPYGNTGGLKVAVVNEDVGATLFDVNFNIGTEIMSNLKTNDKLGWIFCDDKDEAMKMVEEGKVYATIIIPEDFSLSLTTILDDNPKKLSIDYYKNQKLNAIAPKIIDSATNTLKTEISTNIIQTAVEKVLENINSISTDLKEDYPELQDSIDLLDKIRDNVDELPTKLNNLSTNVEDGVVTIDTASDDFVYVKETIDDLVQFNTNMSDTIEDANADIEEYSPKVRADLASTQNLFDNIAADAKYLSNEITTNKPKAISDINELSSNLKTLKEKTGDVSETLTKLNGDGITDVMELNEDVSADIDNMLDILSDISGSSDNITDTKKLLKKLGNLSDDIGDSLEDMDDQVDDLFSTGDDVLGNLEEVNENLADLVASMNNSETIANLTSSINSIVSSLTAINQVLEKNNTTFASIIAANEDIIESLKSIKSGLVTEESVSALSSSVQALNSSLSSVSSTADTYSSSTAEALDNLEGVLTQLQSLLTQIENSNASENTATIITSAITNLESINSGLKNFSAISGALITTNTAIISTLNDMSEDLNSGSLSDLEDSLNAQTKQIKTLRENLADSEDDISDELDDASDVFHQVDDVCDDLYTSITLLSTDIDKYSGSLTTTLTDLKSLLADCNTELAQMQEDESDDIPENMEKVEEQLTTLSTRLDELSEDMSNSTRMVTALDNISSASLHASSFIGTVLNSMSDEALDNLESNLSDGSALLADVNKLLVSSKDSIDDLSAFTDDVAESGKTTVDRLEEVQEDVPKIQKTVNKITDKIDKLSGDVTYDDLVSLVQRDAEEDSDYFASPVELTSHDVYTSENYGKGLSPFYSVLALWVGGMFLGALLNTKVKQEGRTYTTKEEYFGRYLLFGTVALAQGIVTALGDLFLLQIPIHNPVLFVALCSFFSLIFSMMIYALVSTLNNVGKALGIVLLLLQVTASGGTFPIQVTPVFFRTINKFMPFTYAINGLREAIYGVTFDNLMKDIAVLFAYGVIFTLYGFLCKKRMNNIFSKFTLNMKKSEIIH